VNGKLKSILQSKRKTKPVPAKDSAKFNMSNSAASGGAGWTNICGDPSLGIRTGKAGNNNTILFSTVNRKYWTTFTGVCAADNNGISTSGVFPAAVNFQSWFQGSVVLNPTQPQIRISGLLNTSQYTLVMNGIFATATQTDYYARGGVFGAPTALTNNPVTSNDVTKSATITNLSPVNGIIDIFFINDVGSGASFCMMGALTITEQ
jgi:hypothetical protein